MSKGQQQKIRQLTKELEECLSSAKALPPAEIPHKLNPLQEQPRQVGQAAALQVLTQFLWSLIRFPLMAWRFVQLAWPVLQVVMAVSGFLMGLAGLLALVYDYRPQALIASGTPLDDTQPMTMQFSLVNSGKLPIKNIRFQCDLNQIKTSTYVEVSNFTVFGPDSSRIRALVPGEQATVTCALENAFEFPSGTSIVDADVSIVAKFESQGLPWAGSCVFRFVTKRKADNKLYWFPEALITNPVEQMDDPRRTH